MYLSKMTSVKTVWIFSSYFIFNALFCCGVTTINTSLPREYCNGDLFEPECQSDEIIIMQSARYGRMRLGGCIESDLDLGCSSDVMEQFDKECSGKRSCRIRSTERDIKAEGGCVRGVLRSLEAAYICKKAMILPNHCNAGRQINVEVITQEAYLSSEMMDESCLDHGKTWTLSASEGQQLNISIVNLQHTSHRSSVIYGTIKDRRSNKLAVFGSGPRKQHVLMSSSDSVDVVTQSTGQSIPRFLLHIVVNGCPNMAPPDGAWMTRHGDVMEIGCHSGSKSWTLICDNNQWSGVIGYCGPNTGKTKSSQTKENVPVAPLSISLNAMVFGVSSFIIFVSAVIFLVGVLMLKRAHKAKRHRNAQIRTATSHRQDKKSYNFPFQINSVPCKAMDSGDNGYKSLQVPFLASSEDSTREPMSRDTALPPAYSTYANTGTSDTSDSVKYYVLEDVAARAAHG